MNEPQVKRCPGRPRKIQSLETASEQPMIAPVSDKIPMIPSPEIPDPLEIVEPLDPSLLPPHLAPSVPPAGTPIVSDLETAFGLLAESGQILANLNPLPGSAGISLQLRKDKFYAIAQWRTKENAPHNYQQSRALIPNMTPAEIIDSIRDFKNRLAELK